MIPEDFHIITRCSRLNNLSDIEDSVFNAPFNFNVTWHIVFDTNSLIEIPTYIYEKYEDKNVKFYYKKIGNASLSNVNFIIKDISNDLAWIYFLDDDNIIHDDFYDRINTEMKNNPYKKGFIFSQNVDKKDFSKLETRHAKPENVKLGHIDIAQYLLKKMMFNDLLFKNKSWGSDGVFIEELYKRNKDDFHFIDEVLCHYNYLESVSSARVPKVLYIGEGQPELKSSLKFSKFTDELKVKYIENDNNIKEILSSYRPDVIITAGNSSKDFPILNMLDFDTRKKWINVKPEDIDDNLGQIAYTCAMHQILSMNNSKTISYFTPIYNTGKKLRNTFACLKNQTNPNWEWVLVNDSTDMGKTLKIAQEIAKSDHRVKLYDFREKSKGCIGESKYRAAMLCTGHILAELDHDDHITPNLTHWLQQASEDHPDCGFFYTDCASATPDWEPRWFHGLHAFGYGNYRDEVYNGHKLKVTNQHNINPVTIRHIVGVPNHVRAWRRDTYLEAGGHNRGLSIADDYELVVRTFLITKLCRIPHLGYIQFHYTGGERNTHDIVRADIQRRVKSIAMHYHKKIKDRFDELGLYDWAYAKHSTNPSIACLSPWEIGEKEQVANEIWIKT